MLGKRKEKHLLINIFLHGEIFLSCNFTWGESTNFVTKFFKFLKKEFKINVQCNLLSVNNRL